MMNKENNSLILSVRDDDRFTVALNLFNSEKWYEAHDAFEELWHESIESERKALQGLLQIAVAQVHLGKGNVNGATILYGEALGRLKSLGGTTLGLDIENLTNCIDKRLKLLQLNKDPDSCTVPFIIDNF